MAIDNFENIILKNVTVSMSPIVIKDTNILSGINIKFGSVSQNQVYKTSEDIFIKEFPAHLSTVGIDLSLNAVVELNSVFQNTLSTYLFNIRKNFNSGNMSFDIKSDIDNNSYIRAFISKHFFRKEELGYLGTNKVSMSIIVNDSYFGEYESVMFNFSKKDINVLVSMLNKIISSYNRVKSYFLSSDIITNSAREKDNDTNIIENKELEIKDIRNIPITKVDNSILINDTWIHGQEILSLIYIVNILIYKMDIENNLEYLNTFFKQMFFYSENGIIYLELKNKNEENIRSRIAISSLFLSAISLIINVDMINLDYVGLEEDMINNTEHPFYKTKGYLYHLTLKESLIGISLRKRTKDNKQILSLIGKVKDNAYSVTSDSGEVMDFVYKDGEDINDILTEFSIDMKDQWSKLIRGLSLAYTKEYLSYNDINSYDFFVFNPTGEGNIKYQFKITSSLSNKASAVLVIEKIIVKDKEEKVISSFRQPLFDRYVYQLLCLILSATEFIEDIEYIKSVNKLDLIKYRYSSIKNVSRLTKNESVDFGIKKIGGISTLGMFSSSNKMFSELSFQDQYLLNESAKSKILRGFWQPFVGDKISLSQDKYLTTLFGEINLAESGFLSELDWAIEFYIGTGFKNENY